MSALYCCTAIETLYSFNATNVPGLSQTKLNQGTPQLASKCEFLCVYVTQSPHLKSGKITRDCPNRSHGSTIELVMESQPPEVIEEEEEAERETATVIKRRHAEVKVRMTRIHIE